MNLRLLARAQRERMNISTAEQLLLRHHSVNNDVAHGHVLYIARLDHADYLRLLTMWYCIAMSIHAFLMIVMCSDVFLNPFPFGGGITSSDALAACLPVVVLPRATSVLHIALAQVRAFGADLAKRMVANSVDDYVDKAMNLAHGAIDVRAELCARKSAALFGPHQLDGAVEEWKAMLHNMLRLPGS